MRKQTLLVLVPLLVAVGGCLSAPVPEELLEFGQIPPPEPLTVSEVVRLSKLGISEPVIVELLRNRRIADLPELSGITALQREGVGQDVLLVLLASSAIRAEQKPVPRLAVREWYIPLWPSYSRGRWHLGLRVACTYRKEKEGILEIVPPESKPVRAPSPFVDP